MAEILFDPMRVEGVGTPAPAHLDCSDSGGKQVNEHVTRYLAEIGRRGGKRITPASRAARIGNAAKARAKLAEIREKARSKRLIIKDL